MLPRVLLLAFAGAPLLGCARRHPDTIPAAREAGTLAVDVEHYRIEISPDFESRRIEGEVTIRFRPARPELRRLVLDCADLDVYRVEERGVGPLRTEPEGHRLVVDLGRPRSPQESVEVLVRYGGAPARGLYFRIGRGATGEETPQLFTQGEPEDTRYWVPCVDDPRDRATSEIFVTVPEGLVTVAAGALVSQTPDPARRLRTDHWRMDLPHVPYLLTLVVGDFEVVEDHWRDVPLLYVVEPGDVPFVVPTFGRTPEILEFFSEWTGVPYPWPKYAQVCVRDFLWGGMENVSATTLTRRTLHPAEVEREASSVSLVAHEAAHQWFGDLITCATWRDLWLNEGFASYFDLLFLERAQGWEEFRFQTLESQEKYLDACRGEGRHAIAWSDVEDPEDLFDEHVYEGAAARLDLLRFVLGDGEFRRAIRAWAAESALRCVRTGDFLASLERTTGRRLRPFFEDWILGAGYPELRVVEEYDVGASRLVLVVEQTQEPVAETPGVFRVPIEVAVVDDRGERRIHRLDLDSRRGRFELEVSGRPRLVRLDPASRIPKRLVHEKPLEAWRWQAQHDGEVVGRIEAIEALARIAGAPPNAAHEPESEWERPPAQVFAAAGGPPDGSEKALAVEAIARAGMEDPFRGVKERAARSLGQLGGILAREALEEIAADVDPRVRMAAAAALGRFEGDETAEGDLLRLLEHDPSPYVAGAAARSIGRIGRPGAFEALEPHLARASHDEVLRAGVLEGLGELDDPRGLRLAISFSRPVEAEALRPRAIAVVGRLGRADREALAVLEGIPRGADYNARGAAAEALGEAEDALAIAVLEVRLSTEPDGRIRAGIADSIRRVRKRFPEAEESASPLLPPGLKVRGGW